MFLGEAINKALSGWSIQTGTFINSVAQDFKQSKAVVGQVAGDKSVEGLGDRLLQILLFHVPLPLERSALATPTKCFRIRAT